MATRSRSTFQKRQKEMKRMEKQRMKAERRAQKRLASRTENEAPESDQHQGSGTPEQIAPIPD